MNFQFKLLRINILPVAFFATLAFCSCSDKGYDAEKTDALCQKILHGQASSSDYSDLIEMENLAFENRQATMENMLEIQEPLKFNQEFQKNKADTAFIEMVDLSESAWRVLVLSQRDFNDDNYQRFEQLRDLRKIVDMLEDDIARRLRANQ